MSALRYKFHDVFSTTSKSLRRHWPLIAGGIMLTGLALASYRDNRQHDELVSIRTEVQSLRDLVEQRSGKEREPRGEKRHDGRIMFAVSRQQISA